MLGVVGAAVWGRVVSRALTCQARAPLAVVRDLAAVVLASVVH